jgi:hypothetical protein
MIFQWFRFGAVLAALALAASPAAYAGAKRPVVVELFTSQGCNSCPPADALLSRLAERKDVIALSLPVTYWDMFGWKDTLASDANTRRQKAYAAAMGRGGVYTPQMIVDGSSDIVGSRETAIDAAIAAHEADLTAVPVELRATHNELHIAIGSGDTSANATIWLLHILGKATVAVGTGENGGRTLSYRNVVRDVKAVGMWKGQAVTLDLPRSELTSAPHDSVAVIIQQGGYGRIIGAAEIGRPDYTTLW